jgi:hypothetical protein
MTSAATLTGVSDLVTNPAPSATTTHQFTFTTASTGTIEYIQFAFPSGFNVSSATLGLTSGIGAGTLSAPSSTSACYTVTTPVSVSSGTQISVQLHSVVNRSSTGSPSLTVRTRNTSASSCTSGGQIDQGNTSIVINNPASISATAQKVLVFTISKGALSFALNPSSSSTSTDSLNLTVATNTAASTGGYQVTARTGQALTGTRYPGSTIPNWTGTAASPTSWNTGANPNFWGATRTGLVDDSGDYFGITTSTQTIMSGNGPTNGETTTVTFRVAVDYNTPADIYTTTIFFVGTPSF